MRYCSNLQIIIFFKTDENIQGTQLVHELTLVTLWLLVSNIRPMKTVDVFGYAQFLVNSKCTEETNKLNVASYMRIITSSL